MLVSNLRKEDRGTQVALVADVECQKFGVLDKEPSKNTIWVSVSKEYEDFLTTDRYDGFLIILAYVAMAYGENVEINGAVSKRLLRNMNTCIQDIFLAYNSELQRIKITAKETTSEIFPTTKHIGTGFSGGIDSFSTIYDNYVLENDPEYKIDTLFCFNSGTHGKFDEKKTMELFESRFEFLKQYTDLVNLPYIRVDTNIHYYRDMGGKVLVTGDLNLPAIILCLQRRLKKYYIASCGRNYDKWTKEATKYRVAEVSKKQRAVTFIQAFAEPYLYSLLSTETTELILDGMQYTRTQKTINIVQYPFTKQFLNVCIKNEPIEKNCGTCPKCARVGLTLSAIHKLDDYKKVFNIEAYRKEEYRLMCNAKLSYKNSFFMADIVDFARLHGKKFPNRFICVIVCLSQKFIHFFRAIIRRISGKIKQL